MNLRQLLAGHIAVTDKQNAWIKNICLDSRKVQPGDLFLAFPGSTSDGRQFISAAIAQGAAAIVAESEQFHLHASLVDERIPCLLMPQLHTQVGMIAARFYGEPSRQLQMVGVTGTNGKTSTTHFIAQALNHIQAKQCAVIGTVGYGLPDALHENTHTTPDAVVLQKMLADFIQTGIKTVAMEVSSHALVQHRVAAIHYNIGVFTNLTRDHLDYHGDMAHYGAAKQKLFTDFPLRHAVINLSDPFAASLIRALPKEVSLITYSVDNSQANVWVSDIRVERGGMQAKLHTPWGEGDLRCGLLGRFHLHNLLAVIGTLGALNIPFPQILGAIAQLQGVAGRMQALTAPNQPLVVVDYAHTPDALMKALTTLRELTHGKLWCVFGCGGNRDAGKRPMMGSIAEQYADKIIITDDNPRHEDPHSIVTAIVEGIANKQKVVIQHDRRQAIEYAIQQATSEDTILIAGKGHEPYQQIGDEKMPFDDATVVSNVI